jgi:acyl carrier protein
MDFNQILSEVNTIFRNVLNNKKINLVAATTAKDVSEWDSLSNIHLVLDIEEHFKIRFTTPEIQGWKNVGEMVTNIEKKINR